MMQRPLLRILMMVLALAALGQPGAMAGYSLADAEDIQEQIAAVRERLEQVRSLVEESRDEEARRLLDAGAGYLLRAEQNLEQGNEQQARNYVRRALEMVNAAAQQLARNRGISQEQAERELIRMREVLRAAEELAERVNSSQARILLQQAQEEAETARRLFDQRDYAQSLDRTRRAINLAFQAQKMLSNAVVGTGFFDDILAELDRLLERAVAGDFSPTGIDVEEILLKAEQLRQRAAESYAEGRFDQAFDQARRARELLRWVIQSTFAQPIDTSNDQLEMARRERERARALLAEAQEAVGAANDTGWLAGLHQIRDLIEQGENELEAGRPLQAIDLFRQACDLASQLIFQARNRLSEPFPELSEAAHAEYQHLVGDILPNALEQVQSHPTPRAVDFLEQAQSAAERARALLELENYERALQEINLAKTFARRAIEESLRNSSM